MAKRMYKVVSQGKRIYRGESWINTMRREDKIVDDGEGKQREG